MRGLSPTGVQQRGWGESFPDALAQAGDEAPRFDRFYIFWLRKKLKIVVIGEIPHCF